MQKNKYSKPCIAVVGSHSALDVCLGAKKEGFKTLVVCQKGRDATYARYYKTRKIGDREVGVVDEVMELEKFSDIAREENVRKLVEKQALFVPHRSFEVYVGFDRIENDFPVPILGNRALLRAEERDAPKNQYFLLEKAGIRTPQRFALPKDIDRLTIVKVSEARRTYERAFFFASTLEEYTKRSGDLIAQGIISREGLAKAVIEEVVCGAHANFNFFYSPLSQQLELLGTDMRRQTNIDGLLRLPADEQIELVRKMRVSNIEAGHVAITLRESLLDKVFSIGESFVNAAGEEFPPGVIGPFALQGALVPEEKGEEPIIFDVSLRMPGSPGTKYTPYTEYLYHEGLSAGHRLALEVKQALKQKRLEDIVT